MPQDYFKIAQDITRKYARDIKDANNSVRKSRIVEDHAISREILSQQARASVSMNDILEAAGAEGLLQDPLLKMRLKQMSGVINSPYSRY